MLTTPALGTIVGICYPSTGEVEMGTSLKLVGNKSNQIAKLQVEREYLLKR